MYHCISAVFLHPQSTSDRLPWDIVKQSIGKGVYGSLVRLLLCIVSTPIIVFLMKVNRDRKKNAKLDAKKAGNDDPCWCNRQKMVSHHTLRPPLTVYLHLEYAMLVVCQ